MHKRKAGMVCSAINCGNKSYNCNLTFFSFPKDQTRAEMWLVACGRDDLREKINNLVSYRLCAVHFEDRMYTNYLKYRLLPTATPTIFPLTVKSTSSDDSSSRGHGAKQQLEDDIQHKETQRNFDTHGGVPSKRRKIEKNASRAVSTASNQDPLTTEDDLRQNRDIDEENAFGDNMEHSDNSNFSSRIHFVDVKREIIDEIDIKEEPIGLDDSMDSAYTTQGELHIKKEKEEQFDEFGEFVGVSLKQLPDELADHAKSEIENVLMKFKMLAPNMLTK